MDPILVLEEPYLQVEPGAELRTRLRVRNGGTEAERYRIEVLGDAGPPAPRHRPGRRVPGSRRGPPGAGGRCADQPPPPDLHVPWVG